MICMMNVKKASFWLKTLSFRKKILKYGSFRKKTCCILVIPDNLRYLEDLSCRLANEVKPEAWKV